MAREFDFIDWIISQQIPGKSTEIGIGDDLAALRWKSSDLLLIGADQILDGVHFDSAIHAPKLIGAKAMNRNLSDCAAMGCQPVAATVTFAVPRGMDQKFLKDVYRGLQNAGRKLDCEIVGGDTGSWAGKLAISVAIMGKCDGQPVRRNGAQVSDSIYVTGPLGGSILGRHLSFKPKVELGMKLRQATGCPRPDVAGLPARIEKARLSHRPYDPGGGRGADARRADRLDIGNRAHHRPTEAAPARRQRASAVSAFMARSIEKSTVYCGKTRPISVCREVAGGGQSGAAASRRPQSPSSSVAIKIEVSELAVFEALLHRRRRSSLAAAGKGALQVRPRFGP